MQEIWTLEFEKHVPASYRLAGIDESMAKVHRNFDPTVDSGSRTAHLSSGDVQAVCDIGPV